MTHVGERLQDARLRKGVTLDQAAAATKIRKSFLSAIEKDDYRSLPSPAYAKGFVSNYAEYLGIPSREIMPLFKREYDEKKDITVLPEGFTRQQTVHHRSFRIRRALLLGCGLLVLVFGYIFFQYRHAFLPPTLRISSPKENSKTVAQVTVSGTTDDDVTLTVNGDVVTVTDGKFSKDYTLFPGKNTITITAKNRFGKERTVERHIDIQ